MKVKQIIPTIMIAGLLAFAACDYVSNPRNKISTTTGGSTTGGIDPNQGSTERNVLIEDYTGHHCGNCPRGARTVFAAVQASGKEKKAVMISIHSGLFASTGNFGGHPYSTDFRTPAGEAYAAAFDASFNPFFTSNHKNNPPNGLYFAPDEFNIALDSSKVGTPSDFRIDLIPEYNTTTRVLSGKVRVNALKNLTGGTYKLIVLLAEDSIIAAQLDDDHLPSTYVPDYVHRHVLRGAVTDIWGSPIFAVNTTLPAGTKDSLNIGSFSFSVPSAYHEEHCHVIAYIYNADLASPTKYEVYQVEERKIK